MKKVGISLLLICAVFMTGCASIPDLTPDQSEMISEYAASLLLKYDSANHSRLVDTSVFTNQYNLAKKLHDDAEAEYYAKLKAEEDERLAELEAQEKENQAYMEETGNKGGSHNDNDGLGGAEVVSNQTIAEFLDANSLSIDYAGFDVLESYPEDDEDFYFSFAATEGNKLLVVYFNVTNLTSEDYELDVYHKNVKFKLNVNDNGYKNSLSTILEDSLKEFVGTIGGNDRKRLVLITEIPEGTNVESISLSLKSDTGSINKILK